MSRLAVYDDVVAQVVEELSARLGAAVDARIRRERIVLDPGLGFAKDAGHNWELHRRMDALRKREAAVAGRRSPDPPLLVLAVAGSGFAAALDLCVLMASTSSQEDRHSSSGVHPGCSVTFYPVVHDH